MLWTSHQLQCTVVRIREKICISVSVCIAFEDRCALDEHCSSFHMEIFCSAMRENLTAWLPSIKKQFVCSALLSSPSYGSKGTAHSLLTHTSCLMLSDTHTHLLSIDKWSLWAGLTLMEFCSACLPERCKCCQLTLIPQTMRFSLSVSLLRLISSFCSPVHLLGLIIERRVENPSRDKQDQGPELPFWSYLPMAGQLRFFYC